MKFEIGDLVRTVDHTHKRAPYTFEILEISSTSDNCRCFCQEMADAEIGHGGGFHINGERFGHWNFGKEELELIRTKNSKDEVLTTDHDSPRGVTTRIYSSKCKLASSSRFVGTASTTFKLKCRLAKGQVKFNVQSNGMC